MKKAKEFYEQFREREADWTGYIFETRHQAELARKYSAYHNTGDVIVKVCGGGDKVGYEIMDPADYEIWKKQA